MRDYDIEKEMYHRAVELRELQPYHRTKAYPAELPEHWSEKL